MAIHVTSTVDIACDAALAFETIANFENNPRWQDGMVSAKFTSDPPLRVGSTYAQEARFMGRPIETLFEITAYEPGRSITIESRESTFPIQVTRRVEDLGDGRCRVSAEVNGAPGGLFKIAGPLMRRMVSRSVNADYKNLKALLEG